VTIFIFVIETIQIVFSKSLWNVWQSKKKNIL